MKKLILNVWPGNSSLFCLQTPCKLPQIPKCQISYKMPTFKNLPLEHDKKMPFAFLSNARLLE